MMSLTPSLDPPQVESLSSGGHSFLSGNAPLSPSCSVLLPGSGKSLVDRDGCR
jgi:hypothetical protein